MLASLMAVIYAWSRIVLYPTALVWLVALTTAPALGWPAVARWRVWAAWSVLLFIPVWGAVRLGEIDALWLLLVAVVATAPPQPGWAGWWWGVALTWLAWSCQSLVLTRAGACLVASATGGWVTWSLQVLAWLMVVLTWPRTTLPQRMVVLSVALILVAVVGSPWGIWWLEGLLMPITLLVCWGWLRTQPTWTPPVWVHWSLLGVMLGWYVWLNWAY